MSQLAEGARQLPVSHISIRVPWHDAKWDGTVCKKPGQNAACLILPRIREGKKDEAEVKVAGQQWDEALLEQKLPACAAEHGSFLAPFAFTRTLTHPYYGKSKLHDHFMPTAYRHTAHSAACIPFRWMLSEGTAEIVDTFGINFQRELEERAHEGMGFGTGWVQTKRNQLALLDTFFSAVQPRESLCFFYAKQTPLVDDPRRVIVGVGRVIHVGESVEYRYAKESLGMHRAVVWERNVAHSIRSDTLKDGFLLPYHELLEIADRDPALNLADFVAFAPDDAWTEFSYGSEHVGHDAAISSLLACERVLHKVGAVLPGPWDALTKWVDAELNRLWTMRGPCPGLGSALTAFGLGNGNLIAHEISRSQLEAKSEWNEDPWPLVDQVFKDPSLLGPIAEKSIGATLKDKWAQLPAERAALLKLLSRFAITAPQTTRFYQPSEREKAGIEATDAEILENPYQLYELDRGRFDGVGIQTVDRGLFPDPIVREKHPIPSPSALDGDQDARRVRALVTYVLEASASEGHTLQPRSAVIQAIRDLLVDPPCPVDADLMNAVEAKFDGVVCRVKMADNAPAYQLGRLNEASEVIRRVVQKRIQGIRHEGEHPWRKLLDSEFEKTRPVASLPPEERKLEEMARREKAAALQELYASRVSILAGPAGTGKTTLLKILCNLPEVREGVCLLAPTGKARVRMEGLTGVHGAKTIAQFLLGLGRYDPQGGGYRLSDRPKKAGIQTLVVDEASMLTEEMLSAVLDGIQPPDRVILVGDPRQLPPIGSGRPFLDIARRLAPQDIEGRFPRVAPGYAELTIRRRQVGERRDDLMLAEWFSASSPEPGCDEIWDSLARGESSKHVRLESWTTDEELREKLLRCLIEELELKGIEDEVGFEVSLGGSLYNGVPYFWAGRDGNPGAAAAVENWQILSPVRGAAHGVDALNRLLQEKFRSRIREMAVNEAKGKRFFPKPRGREGILYGDKVINTVNNSGRHVYPEPRALKYVANGEIGVVVGEYRTKKWGLKRAPRDLEVEFSTQPGFKYTYGGRDFSDEGETSLSLAYALTVHKTQGSEFGVTFLVVPNPCRLLSRELLYTALTRQKNRLVLLYQGEFQSLRAYSDPYYSDAARRLTNLFEAPRLVEIRDRMFEEGLIHKTRRGEAVRSKSEVIIADLLHSKGIDYQYEKELKGLDGAKRVPDFFIEDRESGKTFVWEHLGMLRDPHYRACWETKLAWYRAQGFLPLAEGGGKAGTLLVTQDDTNGGIDSAAIEKLVGEVFGV
ncbi:MAG: AAA family ATPase [Deltaproteobacteria bacterium]|nr:AAA family ATPase [Deltaproteobacteria bacterium]